MARISGYNNDSELTGNDLLVGSSYEGLQNGSPKYITRTYKLSDLAAYFGGFVNNIDLNDLINRVGDLEDGVDLISTTVTNNTSAIATASQSLTVLTSDVIAQATFQTNLSATFGTFDENGNLTSLSQAFADQVLQTTASDRYANAQFVTNLASSVGTYDANGNLVTLSSAFADQVLSATSTDIQSIATFSTNLAASFGTYNPDGTISEFSNAFANQVFNTTAADQFAQASYVNNLGASIGQLNPDGTLVFDINSTYSQGIKTYIENNSAIAESIETLQSIYTNIPVTIRQPDEPPTLDIFNDLAYPLGSIWVDTDDNNALYVLIEDAGSPTGYSWSPTTSEALGDLILSNSQLQQEVNILSTSVSTEAQKLDTLRSKFGYFDINGDFIVENTSEIIADLRTYADSGSAAALKAETVRAQVNDGENSLVAQVQAASEASATADGFARASYGLKVEAGDVITGVTFVAEDNSISTTSQVIFNTADFIIQNGSGVTQLSINGAGDAVFAGDISAATGTFTGGVSGTGYSLNNSGLSLTNAGSEINIGNGVIIDSDGISGTNFTLNSTGLTATNGTFSGTFTAGGVEIIEDTITLTQQTGLDSSSNILFNNDSGTEVGEIKVIDIGSVPRMYISAGGGLNINTSNSSYNLSGNFMANGNGVSTSTAQIREYLTIRLEETNGHAVYLDSAGVYLSTPGGTFFWVTNNGISCGNSTGNLSFLVNGAPVSGGSSVDLSNYYTKTESDTRYYTKAQVDGGFMPISGGNFTGNVSATGYNFTANDFILDSDATLKQNIKEYTVKPINIQYKEYNFIGDDKQRVGVIAQELEKDHPEFVKITDNGTKAVSYIDMLVAKVAELEQRIKELENGAA